MESKSRCVGFLLAAVLTTTAASAQNLLVNGDFNDGIPPWVPTVQQTTWDGLADVDGCALSGGAFLSAPVGSFEAAARQSCFQVGSATSVYMSYWVQRISGLTIGAGLPLVVYTTTDCSGSYLTGGLPIQSLPVGVWTKRSSWISLPPGTQSMAVMIDGFTECCTGGLEYIVDKVYLGFSEPIFLDDFEAANPCRWSLTVTP